MRPVCSRPGHGWGSGDRTMQAGTSTCVYMIAFMVPGESTSSISVVSVLVTKTTRMTITFLDGEGFSSISESH